MKSPTRLGLFGGTFDPVHLGHLEIARLAAGEMALDEVRFLPCRRSPHKDEAPGAGDADRLAMLEIALRGLDGLVVDDFELRSPPPSWSIRTVRHMRATFPAAKLFWIVGLDQWDALPRWREPEALAELLEFIVFSRDGEPEPRPGWRMHHVRGTHPASSTAIREALREGRPVPPWLPQGVLDHIRNHRLYG